MDQRGTEAAASRTFTPCRKQRRSFVGRARAGACGEAQTRVEWSRFCVRPDPTASVGGMEWTVKKRREPGPCPAASEWSWDVGCAVALAEVRRRACGQQIFRSESTMKMIFVLIGDEHETQASEPLSSNVFPRALLLARRSTPPAGRGVVRRVRAVRRAMPGPAIGQPGATRCPGSQPFRLARRTCPARGWPGLAPFARAAGLVAWLTPVIRHCPGRNAVSVWPWRAGLMIFYGEENRRRA